MGAVFRKTVTKQIPPGAELFTRKGDRFARWKDAKGRSRTAPLSQRGDRIVIVASTFTAKYRDHHGHVREIATGCRDETAARSFLGNLERRSELVKSGVLTGDESAIADHQQAPLTEHFEAFHAHRKAKGLNATRVVNTRARLDRLAEECNFRKLADLDADSLVKWLAARAAEGMGPATRNEYRGELVSFGNWCVTTRRLLANPFACVAKADAKSDQRRQRRAMTEAELLKLLEAARRRPLLDAKTVRRGKRNGEQSAEVRPEVQTRLERLGRERALIYKTLLLTGLRKGELASLTLGSLYLDGAHPFLQLKPGDEKNREGNRLALRADLVADLASWVREMQERATSDARGLKSEMCLPMTANDQTTLPANTPLFNVPAGLLRILDRDLVAAGIAQRVKIDGKWKIDKRDDRGRTIDIHALRHTFCTLLSKGGVAPRTAQAAARHSSLDLTMNVYTDPRLLDVHGALSALPCLPLNSSPSRAKQQATGTDGNETYVDPRFAPGFAPTPFNPCHSGSAGDRSGDDGADAEQVPSNSATLSGAKNKPAISGLIPQASQSGRHDLNMRPLRPERSALARLSYAPCA